MKFNLPDAGTRICEKDLALVVHDDARSGVWEGERHGQKRCQKKTEGSVATVPA
jgi:hypothetical protein